MEGLARDIPRNARAVACRVVANMAVEGKAVSGEWCAGSVVLKVVVAMLKSSVTTGNG